MVLVMIMIMMIVLRLHTMLDPRLAFATGTALASRALHPPTVPLPSLATHRHHVCAPVAFPLLMLLMLLLQLLLQLLQKRCTVKAAAWWSTGTLLLQQKLVRSRGEIPYKHRADFCSKLWMCKQVPVAVTAAAALLLACSG